MPFTWQVTPEQAFMPWIAAYIASIRQGVRAIADSRSPEIESWMKVNAPWTDRSAAARQSLNTSVEQMGQDMVRITLAHGVSYGIWLELAHSGSYQILGTALDHWGPIIWADVQRLLR